MARAAPSALALILFLLLPVATPARAASDDCDPPINGALKGGSGNIQDHMFHSLTIDPTNANVVYAGTETNGIFKTTDGGQTWSRLRIGLKCTEQHGGYSQIFEIAIDPTNPQNLFAATVNGPGPASPTSYPSASGGIYRSTDGGATWTQKNNGLPNTYASYVLVDGTNPQRVYAMLGGVKSTFPLAPNIFYEGGVYVSVNSGDSWAPLALPQGVSSNIVIDAVIRGADQRTLYGSGQVHGTDAPTAYGFFRSMDAGATWSVSNPAGQTIYAFDAFKQDPRIVYGHDNSAQRRVHKSVDGGTTWTALANTSFFGVVRIHPTNSQVLYYTTFSGIRKTADGFATSQEVFNDPLLTSVQQMVDIEISESNPNVVWAAAKGYYLYRSADAGQTWTRITAIRDTVYGADAAVRAGAVFSTTQAASQSFLRFYNTGAAAGTATVTLADAGTGAALGQWTSPSIPAGAALQYGIGTIENGAGLVSKPATYSISVSTSLAGAFQHVLWRASDGTLTNLSTCAGGITANRTALNSVHSSLLAAEYPSSVVVNNTGSAASATTLALHDARDGTRLGGYTTPAVPAGGQHVITVAAMESAIGFTPGAGVYHYVIKAEGSFSGFLQHTVNNIRAGVVTDMTNVCAVNTTVSTTTASPLRAGAVFSTAQTASQSYLRFYNTGAVNGANTVTVTLSDGLTGQSLGQWTSPTIPAGTSPQYAISTIESGITPTFAKPAYYAISVRPGISGYFQHVLFRAADGTITNLSTCAAGVTANRDLLTNVHSSLLGPYPSAVVVNNTGTAAATVTLALHDARTAVRLGAYTTSAVAAGGHLIVPVGDMEIAAGVSPAPDKYHYVIRAEGAFTGFLQHLVTNTQAGVITDMTTLCVLPPAA